MYIYADNAATTKTSQAAIKAMNECMEDFYGNPSSIYSFAGNSKKAVEDSRKTIANFLGAKTEEIYFTGGGSESDNWALKATADAYGNKGKHIITSKIEHHAILRTCGYLEQNGYEITYLPVNDKGTVSLEQVRRAIRPDTILISVMMANNEIGTIEPIARIGMLARRYGICFHTDAVQAYGHIPIDVNRMNIDMMSASAHKFNGPKGTGFLYVRKKKRIPPFIHGGGQESGVRAGTENVPGIVGMGKAAAMAMESLKERMEIETRMRDYLIYSVLKQVPKVRLNGEWNNRLPNNVDFCFDELEGGNLLVMLDMDGICASAGSACSSGEHEPSHVLTAIGVPPEIARGALRLTLNEKITAEQIDYVTACIKKNVTILRGQKETVKFT